MRDANQPDLFDEPERAAPATPGGIHEATIIAFPLCRQAGLVRSVVTSVLKRRNSDAQQAEFNRHARSIAKRLSASGVPEDEVDRQLVQFADAANAELFRLQHETGRQRGPGGAA